MERRKFIKSAGLVAAAAYVGPKLRGNDQLTVKSSKIEGVPAPEFPPLPYGYNALEPYIDARTVEIHYDILFLDYSNKYCHKRYTKSLKFPVNFGTLVMQK